MKKQKLLTAMLMMALCLPMATSCGDDDSEPKKQDNEQPGNDKPDVTPVNKVLTTTEQKEYLEDVGLELNGKFKADEFRHYSDLAQYIDDTYGDYDWDDVEEWAEDIWDELRGKAIGTHQETETEDWGGWTSTYVYNYTDYKAVLMASNFTGRWEARNGRWNRKDASDLSFVFKNESGQECVLRLTTSGTVTKVHLYDSDDWVDYSYESTDNGSVSNEYYDRTNCTIGVPQHITITLTEGGKTLVESKTDIDLSNIKNEEFDLSQSAVTAKTTVTLSNGYTIKGENIAYSKTSVTANATLIKGSETLVKASFSCNLSNIPSEILTAYYDMDDDDLDDSFRNSNGNVTAFSVDVLGKVQVKGSINDLRQLADDFEAADDDEENESKFKQDVANINSHITANIYYNGGTTKQASFLFIPFEDRWDNYSEWYCEPGLKFPDGSTYTFENFFTEDDFKDLIDAFERLEDDFEALDN